MATFTAPSRLLVAAERQGWIKHVVAVEPHRSGAKLGSDTVRFADVARPDRGRESVDRIVGELDDLVRIIEGNCSDDGAKDFLADDFHVRLHVDQDGGLDEISRAPDLVAPDDGLGAFFDAGIK